MHDVVIIGGGHNGLVCSAYLAMAGFKVLVLEQRSIVGGAAVTEEFCPGFFNSVASYTVSLLNPKIIRDLDLASHGLHIVERPISNFLPLDDGRFLKVGGGQTKQQIAKFSARDAERLEDYQTRLDAVADVLRATVLETPPNVVEGSAFSAISELIKVGRIGNRVRALGLDLQRDFLDLFTASAGDFLDSWFESAPIKAVFGFDSIVGNYASPYPADVALIFPVAKTGKPRKHHIPDQPPVSAEAVFAGGNWQRVSWRWGTKGRLTCLFAARRVRVADGHTDNFCAILCANSRAAARAPCDAIDEGQAQGVLGADGGSGQKHLHRMLRRNVA